METFVGITRSWTQIVLVLAIVAAGNLGCNAKPTGATVVGKISYQSKPVKDGTILFMPRGGLTVTGNIEPGGKFKLVTPKLDEHIPLGKYTVVIITDASNMAQMSEDPMALGNIKPAIPLEFSSSATSPLEYEVKEGANEFDIVLDDHLRPIKR